MNDAQTNSQLVVLDNRSPVTIAVSVQYDTLLRIVRRNWWLSVLVTAAFLGVGIAYLRMIKPLYSGTSRLYVELSSPKVLKNEESGDKAKNYLFTQETIIRSVPVLEQVVQMAARDPHNPGFRYLPDKANPIQYLQSRLTATVGKKDEVISVTFTSEDPDESALVTNAVVDSYVQYQSGKIRTTAGELLGILQTEKMRYDQELNEKLQLLTEFKKKNKDIVFISGKGDVSAERLSRLSDALTLAQLETMQNRVAYESIKTLCESPTQLREYAKARKLQGSITLENEESNLLRTKLNSLQLQLDKLLRVLTPEHPSVKAMEDKIATTFSQLEQMEKEYVQSQMVMAQQQYVVSQEKEKQIQAQYEQQRKLALDVNEKYSDYILLESQWQQTKKMSDLLDERIREVDVTENAGALDIHILERALVPLRPSWPNPSRILALALAAGLLSGAGLSLLRDFFDKRFGCERDIQEVLGCPVLGLVPQIQAVRSTGRFLYVNGHAILGHIFRKICAVLLCRCQETQNRILHVCSGQHGEGKSFIVLHLALGMAQSGQRTLLLDCCHRGGVLRDQLGVAGDFGLYDILNKTCSVPSAVIRTGIENLDFLSCGRIYGNPMQVFHHERFRTTLRLLACQYDRILIDSGSYLSSPESLALSRFSDGVIFVLDGEKSNQSYTTQIRKELDNLGIVLLGAIVNKIRSRGSAFIYSPVWFQELMVQSGDVTGDLLPVERSRKETLYT